MSENKKKIYKVTSQHALAKQWAEGNDAKLRDYVSVENGVVIANVYRYVWGGSDYSYTNHRVILGYTDDNGDRIVYNYTAQNLADTYLWFQRPNKWNNNQPRLPDLLFAEVGKGRPLNSTGLSSQLICKLIESGKATKILLPPEEGHPHYVEF
jgi:hypothetical protein